MHANCEPFNIEKGVPQGCILPPHLFNLYTEQIMRQADIDGMGINIGGRDITNLRYAGDTALLSDNLTSMKRILHRVNNAEVTASSSLNAERPTQARHFVQPHRRIKGATHHPEGKENRRQQQQQENRRSTKPNKQDKRRGQAATRCNLNQNCDNTDGTIVTVSPDLQHPVRTTVDKTMTRRRPWSTLRTHTRDISVCNPCKQKPCIEKDIQQAP
ncbi:hypothetical protein ElyMa_002925200 [Elysia marginata]|uniref:Reverse transcriptase domain-containing protein n=1 Tax=Elysia marginata TaxID=1093978 RepID=A0AAV4I359_9GAST|nr:hypothetical protein ElyMa_002925200 [Elysia marginata]